MVRSYRELEVWQKGMDLVVAIYAATKKFPADERFGLCSQLQRAAVSVPSNIAEGQSRTSTKEFVHHLSIARGSLAEIETQIEIAVRLGYIPNPDDEQLAAEAATVGRMLSGLIRSLRRKLEAGG
ncbi:hypothetical protein LF1_06970 [Rubripirellula obstinata]|uniref:Four helix bundle protein n=1 Tax=Rubripirellula obstinata TaxID=406547 RepID=A0A5B1CD70_9BACT|nr:four helix bundle protein [Rubripirellula obstinata]KAA1258181.1 hypothetical protein LF1_06970 [Rubripirellula obstinata]